MIKAIVKLICMTVIASLIVGVIFVAVSVYKGGDVFRNFGSTVKEKSVDAGKAADKIKSLAGDVKETAKDKGEKIKSVTSETFENVSEKADTTGKMLKDATTKNSKNDKDPRKAISNLSGD